MTMGKRPSNASTCSSSRPTTANGSRKRRLYCTNGHYLEINYNGTVKGTMNDHSPLVVMELIPAGKDLIQIKGAHTGLYLAMAEGEVYTTKIPTDECLFRENLSKVFCDNYFSSKYGGKKLLIGLLRTGTVVAISQQNAAKDKSKYTTQFITKMATT